MINLVFDGNLDFRSNEGCTPEKNHPKPEDGKAA
jgi:hypothetical protein